MSTRLLSLLFVPAIACGGGDTPTPKPVDSPPPTPDSPPAVVCPEVPSGTLNLGSAAMPVENDWFFTPTQGPNTGMKTFSAGGRLNQAAKPDILIANYVLPLIANTAANFETNAASTASTKAVSFVFGGFDTTAQTADTFLFASSGSITISQLGENDGDLIKGSVTATNYREVDDAGLDVAGGCTASIGGLVLELKQKAAAFQDTSDNGEIPGLVPLTDAEWALANRLIQQKLGRQ